MNILTGRNISPHHPYFIRIALLGLIFIISVLSSCSSPDISRDRELLHILDQDEHFQNGSLSIKIQDGHITSLSLKDYQGEALPIEIGALDSIRHLEIATSKLKTLSIIEQLITLESVIVSGTPLEKMPNLGAMPALNHVVFSSTQIQDTVDARRFNPNITSLIIRESPIKYIIHLNHLENLKMLAITDCQLADFPEAYCALNSLWSLNIEGNPFGSVDTLDFRCLKNLSSLDPSDMEHPVFITDQKALQPQWY
ncbi:hypothetical protein [Pontibacter sp. G13]|uniref:leucine-rich repeat domain-containing protein n=1 Tax=Pontibacter sp. G13 TaxID=3074898 RepID=UPI00288B58CA|nr:hypothetical protein [Pontibacter sp. G13]WNJ18808.1 hypothetical protein RJD25_28460 [Pontibacter sp. G13]